MDLSEIDLSPGTTTVEASLGIGEMVLIVPRGTELRIEYEVGAGEAAIQLREGETRSGLGVEDEVQTGGYGRASARLRLVLSLGLGSVKVREG